MTLEQAVAETLTRLAEAEGLMADSVGRTHDRLPSDEPVSLAPVANRAASGGVGLTGRERETATLVARGLTNRQIADALIVTEGTAANYVQRVLNKLGFTSRAQIAAWATEHGLGPSPRR